MARPTLVAFWASYNRYLAHILEHLPDDALTAKCRIGVGEPVTLQFLAEFIWFITSSKCYDPGVITKAIATPNARSG